MTARQSAKRIASMKNCLPKLGLFGPRGWLIQRGKERVLEPKTATATHCPYCALQCGMNLVPGDGALTVAPRDRARGSCRTGERSRGSG